MKRPYSARTRSSPARSGPPRDLRGSPSLPVPSGSQRLRTRLSPRNPQEDFEVRSARSGDLRAISALDAQITSIDKTRHWRELLARSQARSPTTFFHVAVSAADPARVLGFIVGEIRAWEFGSAPCGWVYALSVVSEMREHHVGEALLEAISGEFRRRAITKMRTMVARDSTLPLRFFRGEGMMAGPYIQLEKDLE